ncbi:hypothetical protein [Rhizorhapis sp. SPR117]|uniref:hypothetical protein n=1 Tax=Rhizorhapis sp. SPR117 TaxID=2912611 RepID=UPI001F2AE56C|nr:hypothetical protein [Rhizorhapis sp. SPR117]
MKAVEEMTGHGGEAAHPLHQALKTLQLSQRMLTGGAADLAAPHVQFAIDLIEPLARRQTTCLLLPIDGGKMDRRTPCTFALPAEIAS